MTRDRSNIMMRLFTVALLMIFSMGARADVKILYGEKGTEKFEGTGGTIEVKQEDSKDDKTKVTVTLIVTPSDGYTLAEKNSLEVYAVISPDGASTRALEISGDALDLTCNDFKDISQKRSYTVDIDSKLALWVKSANFQKKRDGAKGGGDEDGYSGTYFIKSESSNKNTAGDYYMCPTKNWYLYKATNSYEDDTDDDDDNGKPFLTTYQCKIGNYDKTKAVWIVQKHPTETNCYYIIQARTGRYMVSNGKIGSDANRMRVHLESVADATALSNLGDLALFEITSHEQHIDIVPHSSVGRNGDTYKYLVVNFKNFNELKGSAGKGGGPSGTYGTNTAGIIGLYDTELNHKWSLETAEYQPVITNNLDGTVTITSETGATIYYTIDGTTPTTSTLTSGTSPVTVTLNGSSEVVKAIAKSSSYVLPSSVTTYNLPKCERPFIKVSGGIVTITCATEGATIHYTTDGTSATSTSTTYTAPFAKGDATAIKAIATKPGYVKSTEAQILPPSEVSSSNQITDMSGNYILADNFTLSSSIGTSDNPFTGTIDGNMVTRTFSYPLIAYAEDATIKNVILDNVNISGGTNAGAICNEATGDTRIYNCGVLATDSEVETDKDGYTHITTCSSTISGSGYVGGIVGLLDGGSRVINCFSYADITDGSYVGGIVGWNNVATTSTNPATMVMNCMFYGDITGGTSKAPIYNGQIITNRSDQSGVSNFNYFWAGASYVQEQKIDNDRYNCALSAETRYLQRFEFFRHLLNSNRELAAWWVTDDAANKNEIMKWVMEPSQIGTSTPYPILKAPYDSNNKIVKYPSVVNIDAKNAIAFTDTEKKLPRNKGCNFGALTINIQNATSGAPTGADIIISPKSVTPNITDKDPKHFNFNYYKVQLPYYNDVGSKNYTGNKVVTGWKIVSISGGTHDFSDDSSDASASVNDDSDITLTTPYNFADRKCTDKDDFNVSGRVFNQGAYFDVPEGVTSITIEPYWGKCVYVSDQYPDVVYNQDMSAATPVTTIGGGVRYSDNTITIDGSTQTVYTSMSEAVTGLNPSGTVYDNAIVLVGNVHSLDLSNKTDSKPYTIMSIDRDNDNEPDYSYILRFDGSKGRLRVHPVRIDFLNVIGLGMAQKSNGGTGTYNFGIMQPLGWFEVTNTGLFRVTQFEYDRKDRTNGPMILHGGVIEQWVTVGETEAAVTEANAVDYYHVGSNVWFKEFHIGAHQDKTQLNTPHPPISVTGGDFDEFYLTGLYNTPNTNYDDNAECYINGGRFGKMAGTGMQGIGHVTNHTNGNIIWQIDNADIDEFYAGGINAAHKAEGNIWTVISNSRVDQFCGGPKFGDMNESKKVVTNATNCTFRTFFGAGYGGNSYNRWYPTNKYDKSNYDWNDWLATVYNNDYNSTYKAVATRIDYQFIPRSNNKENVARLFVDYISFSLATTHDVTSKLTGCTITKDPLGRLKLSYGLGNFYGGGSLGKVDGPVKSMLINCTVEGNVYGAGYSATVPNVAVMNNSFQTEPHYDENLGAYLEAELPSTVSYTWEHADEVNSTNTAINTGEKKLFTTENLDKSNLGSVTGAVTLTLTSSDENGKTKIGTEGDTTTGNVYGGGESSYVTGAGNKVTVNLEGNTQVLGNVYGGGDSGVVEGSTEVNIEE